MSRREWRALLQWFVRGVTSAEIARETGLDRKRVLRALLIVRRALLRAEPNGVHRSTTPRVPRVAVIGLAVSNGRASAELLPTAAAEHVGRWVRGRNGAESVAPRAAQRYMAVVYRGRLYRVTGTGAERMSFGPIGAFWASMQRQLRAKGGIRRERLDMYLASFAWRYNRRKLPTSEQVSELLALLARPAQVA
jgi:hypothetical protein